MYCGSCFRDNGLAAELIARGHDVTLIPVYTPTRTDETNVSRNDVLFGGISVYLQQYSTIFRRTPRFVDRLWDSPRVIDIFAGRAVSPDARVLGEMTISTLQGEHGVLRKEFHKLVEWTQGEPLPDVINIPNSLLIAMADPLRRAFGRPIVCTLQGEELFLGALDVAYRDRAVALIREQIRQVDHFIAVSEYCGEFMTDFLRIPADRVSVVPLGITMAGYVRRPASESHDDYRVGYFARVAPEKGLHVLAEAYVKLRQRTGDARITLQVAGYMDPNHRSYLEKAHETVRRAGFGAEFSYHGTPDRLGKQAFLRGLDVLSVPATYDEPKGMFLLECMASGVPVVQPRRGAFTEMVEKTGGGLLVTPDDPDAIAEGLHRLWTDRTLSAQLADRAFDGVRAHYTVAASADRLLEVYEKVTRRTGAGVSC
jgi:glycosyltransferase involved in cell wall biosynthesis